MIPPQVIAALVGAAMGAGKTAMNKESRKNPMAYIKNAGAGAVGGAVGGMGAGSAGAGAMAGLQSGMPLKANASFFDGEMGEMGQLDDGTGNPVPLPPMEPGSPDFPIPGHIEKGGGLSPKAQAAVDLLKAWLGRSKPNIPQAVTPDVAAPTPLNISGLPSAPVSQFRVDPIQPLMHRRDRRY